MEAPASETMTCGQRLLWQLAASDSARRTRAATGTTAGRSQRASGATSPKHARGHLDAFENGVAQVEQLPRDLCNTQVRVSVRKGALRRCVLASLCTHSSDLVLLPGLPACVDTAQTGGGSPIRILALLTRQSERHDKAWAEYLHARAAARAAHDAAAAGAARRLRQARAELHASAEAALEILEDPQRAMELDERGVEEVRDAGLPRSRQS